MSEQHSSPGPAASPARLRAGIEPLIGDLSTITAAALSPPEPLERLSMGPDESGKNRFAVVTRSPLPVTSVPIATITSWSFSPAFPRDRSVRVELRSDGPDSPLMVSRTRTGRAVESESDERALRKGATGVILFDPGTLEPPASVSVVGVLFEAGYVFDPAAAAGATPAPAAGPGLNTLWAATGDGLWLLSAERSSPWSGALSTTLRGALWDGGPASFLRGLRDGARPPALPGDAHRALFPRGTGALDVPTASDAAVDAVRRALTGLPDGDAARPTGFALENVWVVVRTEDSDAGGGRTLYVRLRFFRQDGQWRLDRFPLAHVTATPQRG